jgi:hypothetical protein
MLPTLLIVRQLRGLCEPRGFLIANCILKTTCNRKDRRFIISCDWQGFRLQGDNLGLHRRRRLGFSATHRALEGERAESSLPLWIFRLTGRPQALAAESPRLDERSRKVLR